MPDVPSSTASVREARARWRGDDVALSLPLALETVVTGRDWTLTELDLAAQRTSNTHIGLSAGAPLEKICFVSGR